jgi:hypothetical protein
VLVVVVVRFCLSVRVNFLGAGHVMRHFTLISALVFDSALNQPRVYSSGALLCLSLISLKNHVRPPSVVVALSALDRMIRVGRSPQPGTAVSNLIVVFVYAGVLERCLDFG